MEKPLRKHVIIASVLSGVIFVGVVLSFYRFSKIDASQQDWMGKVPDTAALSELSIPGSHDSGAFYSFADVAGKCQDASIDEQLSYGVRFFDVRLRNESNSLNVYHGFINEGLSFDSLLSPMYSFLKAHSSECLLLSIKEECLAQNTLKTFDALVKETVDANPSYWLTSRTLPATLKAARGKIILLSRYPGNTIGVDAKPADWLDPKEASSSNTFTIDNNAQKIRIQDHYMLLDNETKWSEASALLDEAAASVDKSVLYLNFFSGYLTKGFPPSYSVTTAKYINPRLFKELPASHKGVLIVDFVTKDLVAKLLEGNPS